MHHMYRELKKLKDCFNCLDADGGGTIGLEELENPLIGLGFADTRDDVQKLIDIVDKDGNGDIDFDEFWSIIKSSDRDEKERQIYEFFKEMTSGSISLGETNDNDEDLRKYIDPVTNTKVREPVDKSLDSELSFTLLVQKIRRKYMMNAITSKDDKKRVKGQKILKNVEKQLAIMKAARANNFDIDDDLVDEYKIDFGI